MRKIKRDNTGLMEPGQELVVAGFAGQAGAAAIAQMRRQELLAWFTEAYLDRAVERARQDGADLGFPGADMDFPGADLDFPPPEPGPAAGPRGPRQCYPFWEAFGATEWEPAGEGGILTAVWTLSGAYGTGVEFALRRIPVRQETVEICERFGLNPYRLYSGGCHLLAAKNGGRLVRSLKEEGIAAAVVGTVTDGITRAMTVEEGRSFLERPRPDEIYKAVPQPHGPL